MSTQSPEGRNQRLAVIRREIDEVDTELLNIINKRAALSLEVGRIKTTDPGIIFKPLREREVLEALEARNPGPLPAAHVRGIWREILSSSRALQRPQKVAYLGPEGTFSYFAGVEYLGRAVDFQPCRDLHDVFRAVHERQCELGVVPLENSLQGTVGQSFDLFYKYPVHIQAELYSRISHSLLSTASSLATVKRVYSHPQPLAQCGAWLRANLPDVSLIPVESTAAAARRAATEPDAAAIGHVSLADLLCLRALALAIEDEPGNWTRFVIIGAAPERVQGASLAGLAEQAEQAEQAELTGNAPMPQPGHTGADKSSLLFTLPDKPGSLAAVLETLAKHKVNMRKLESRPLKGECWKYVFFADVESDLEDKAHQSVVEELRHICNTFRILGSYPTGPQLDRATASEPSSQEGDCPCSP